jgi:hypothetical protein
MDFQEQYLKDLQAIKSIKITSGNQCKNLSEEIFKSTGSLISFQTLRRVLGFIKTDTQPTIQTLNILSRFLEFDSYDSYIRSVNSKEPELAESEWGSLARIVYINNLRIEKDLNYHFVCRGLSNYFYNNPGLIQKIPKSIIATESFENYFIGRFPLLDLLDHGFGDLLKQYEKQQRDAKLFVQTVLYLHDFKAGKVDHSLLKGLDSIDIKDLHPFLIGRYYGIQSHLHSDPKERNQLFKTLQKRLKKASDYDRLCILFNLLDFTIAIELYEESLALLAEFDPNPANVNGWVEFGYFEVFKIYHLLCLAKTDQLTKAAALAKKISIGSIAFYFRKTYQQMYLQALIILEKDQDQQMILERELDQLMQFLYAGES